MGEIMNVHGIPCPSCGILIEHMTTVGQPERQLPRAGDFTVCGGCASVLIFDDVDHADRALTVALRLLTPLERIYAGFQQDLQAAVSQVRARLWRMRPGDA